MIELAFIAANREVVLFKIQDKVIRYYDKFWHNGLQIMPYHTQLVTVLKGSKSQMMKKYGQLIEDANSGESLEEYNKAKSDEDLAEIVRRDCRSKGLVEVKQ